MATMTQHANSRMRRLLLSTAVVLVIFGFAQTASAQSLFPNFGDQRVGTSAMTFLKIPVGARAEGMAGAYVAVANDAFAVFWNPGGIAQLQNRWTGVYAVDPLRTPEGVKGPIRGQARVKGGDTNVGFVHTQWIAELQFDAVSAITPVSFGVLAFSAVNLKTADMEITTEYLPDGTGNYFSYSDMLMAVSWAWPMTQNFSWGVTTKFAREILADTYMDNVMIDIGTYYWTGFRDLRLGVALMHFGPNARPQGSYTAVDPNDVEYQQEFTSYAPPTEFSLGSAMTLYASGHHKLLAAMQLNHPVDNSENFRLGAEYSFGGQLFLRAGTKLNSDEDHWTLGGGIRIPFRTSALGLDASYTDYGLLDNVVRMSAELSF